LGNTREYGADPRLMVAARKLRIPVREEAFSRHIPALLRRRKKENAEWIKQGKLPFEVHVIRIGDCVLVGLESEPVVEIGLEIKDRVYAHHSEIRQALVVGYAGNSSYYLTVPRMFEEGGYEHEETLLAREASGLVIDAVVRMVDGMWTTD